MIFKIGSGLLPLVFFAVIAKGQSVKNFADSIRIAYAVPELAYAVVKADTVLEIEVSGFKKIGTDRKASLQDRFHIGSNTKAVTAFIAAQLVREGKINWQTTFFSLFPELKKEVQGPVKDFHLADLLSFRAALPPYTYSVQKPLRNEITGDEQMQRYLLAKYLLAQKPVAKQDGLYLTNTGYILAGLMLEKASGKSYKALVKAMGQKLDIDFRFDYPNKLDTLQTWGHDPALNPVAPFDNYKLAWLLSAGNINTTLPGYIRFIQQFLNPTLLDRGDTDRLLFGRPGFAFGWFNEKDPAGHNNFATNEGNAGAFFTKVQVMKKSGIAYIIFTNAATGAAAEGAELLMQELKKRYEK